MSCTLERTSTEPSRITRTSQAELVCTLAPQSDCAMPSPRLIGPGSAPGAWPALPADPFGADAPLFAPDRARVDPVAQRERIDAELFGQFVDRLFKRKGARRIARARAWRSPARH